MKRGQLAIVAVAVLAVVAVALFASGGGGDKGGKSSDSGGSKGSKAPAGALKVSFAYSPEKEKLLVPLIKRFNERGVEAAGKKVFVEGDVVASGEAESKIARGRLETVAWSPASSLWGRLLNFDADRPYAPRESPSLVRTPLVIAMWEPFARALGWPRKKIGFNRILELTRDPQGFGSVGHPEFGRFKLVHTNPDFSTAGLESVVAEYYAATGKKEGLTEKDISGSKARKIVRDIEQSIVHYGDTTLFIADQMRKEGPGYASAAAMEEVTLLDFNRNRGRQPRLVALYPPEGTFYSDDPYIVLDAPWVSGAERAGAQAFQKFLADEIDPAQAAQSGFRPGDLKAKPEPPIEKKNGVDPAQPQRVLGLPEPRVLSKVKAAWRADRKPANVLLVVDTSGSMNDENRLNRAKEGLKLFLREVSPRDRLGLMTFSDTIQLLEPLGEVRSNRARLASRVNGLVADGGTAFFDATADGFQRVRKLADRNRINAVVLLTDGEDTDSNRNADDVTSLVRSQGDSSSRVRIFTIAYSAGAQGAEQALAQIAKASGGQEYQGDTEDIESVYRSISSFF